MNPKKRNVNDLTGEVKNELNQMKLNKDMIVCEIVSTIQLH